VTAIELEHVVVGWNPQDVLAIYDDLSPDLHGYAVAVSRNPGAAEDLVQETFLRLLREHRRGNPPADPRAWTFRVCTNLVRSRFRRRVVADRHQATLVATAAGSETAESPESSVLRLEDHRELRTALAKLPDDVRCALMLSAEGFSGREIARTLGKSEGATRTLLWRGRLELRRLLSEDAR
jgi:RNA polymerase sigma-70 factor, ECF subfamily